MGGGGFNTRQIIVDKGFTLSEVLITLGIIGIIAAFTIPGVISKYNKKVTEENLKVAYSLLSQAIQMSEEQNGSVEYWNIIDIEEDGSFAQRYIFPYLNLTQNCGLAMHNKSCFFSGSNQNGWFDMSGGDTSGGYGGYGASYFSSAVLSNGMIIGVINKKGLWNSVKIAIDINGRRCEQKIGKDVFYFYVCDGNRQNKKTGLQTNPLCTDQTRTKIISEASDYYTYGNCATKGSNGNGHFLGEKCTDLIMKEGWKIPEDYPIKL